MLMSSKIPRLSSVNQSYCHLILRLFGVGEILIRKLPKAFFRTALCLALNGRRLVYITKQRELERNVRFGDKVFTSAEVAGDDMEVDCSLILEIFVGFSGRFGFKKAGMRSFLRTSCFGLAGAAEWHVNGRLKGYRIFENSTIYSCCKARYLSNFSSKTVISK
jgi:hypothetical protein